MQCAIVSKSSKHCRRCLEVKDSEQRTRIHRHADLYTHIVGIRTYTHRHADSYIMPTHRRNTITHTHIRPTYAHKTYYIYIDRQTHTHTHRGNGHHYTHSTQSTQSTQEAMTNLRASIVLPLSTHIHIPYTI